MRIYLIIKSSHLARIMLLFSLLLQPLETIGQETAETYLHFALNLISLEDSKKLIDKAHSSGFDVLVLGIRGAMANESYRGIQHADNWSKGELENLVAYARSKDMKLVPEIKLLTHQEKFFGTEFPHLMFNRYTYDPRIDEVYDRVFRYLDEIVTIFDPQAIHIGHDELAGHSEISKGKFWLRDDVPLPADLFLMDVMRIYEYLKKHKIDVWMWGDMLISPDEFPSMKAVHLHGSLDGYGKTLRENLPKDIVIFDWHYFGRRDQYPSMSTLIEEGFSVVGATWHDTVTTERFSSFAKRAGASGMMLTTWFYVQKHEWNKVFALIEETGKIFNPSIDN